MDGVTSPERPDRPAGRARSRMTGTERREQLLDVGRRLFAERGFEGTSVEEIAARAGVSKPVVYEHFGGKEGLYAVVVDREIATLLAAITGELDVSGRHPRDLLERAALRLLDYVEGSADGFRILVRDSPVASTSGTFASLISDVASQVEHLLVREFERTGLVPSHAPMYAQMLVGMVALTGQWWLDSRRPAKAEVAAHLVNLAWNGLSGLEARPSLVAPVDGSPRALEYVAFSDDPAGGNPAGVVLDAADMSDAEMQALAARLGHSETAFVVGRLAEGGYALRYFSPRAEVPFCGHATVATAVALAERRASGAQGGPALPPREVVFTTASGVVPALVSRRDDGVWQATLTSVAPRVEEVARADLGTVLGLLGWDPDDLDPALPPRIAAAGARHLVLAARTRERLARLEYPFEELAAVMRRLDLTTLQLVHRVADRDFFSRNPFPVGGKVEDPATGAAALALGAYLRALGLVQVPPEGARVVVHQGQDLGRPSLLEVDLVAGDERVRVTGAAVRLPPSVDLASLDPAPAPAC